MSQLMTFVKPKPNTMMMGLLVPINRWLNLKGTSLLKWIPLVNRMPVVKGLCDITKIEIDEHDSQKLKFYINKNTVAFISPNHPEFYTDWMLDKEISARFAPKMASWATHEVVNGMGKGMQNFWLKNNLIAQIPGTGNKEAKDYSIDHAINGHGVLLHPEGHVGWHSDKIAPLFSGIFDMAYQAYENTDGKKSVYMIPVVWKLSFNKDVTKQLHKEISYIEKELNLMSTQSNTLENRISLVFKHTFEKIVNKYNMDIHFENVIQYHNEILNELTKKLALKTNTILTDEKTNIKILNKKVKELDKHMFKEEHKMNQEIKKLVEFDFSYFNGFYLTQENMAELLKKIRIQYCTKGIWNMIHKFVPTPIAARTAFIQVPDAICLNELVHKGNKETIREQALAIMKNRMQQSLDDINTKLLNSGKVIRYKNSLCK